MKISVVIPAHNEEEYIAETLKAVLKQDYPDFEVIVVDNASTDRTSEIAGSFPVRVVSENRKGVLWAREKGRLEAYGQIIANLDADCLAESDWLSRAEVLFNDPLVSAVTGPYDYHDLSTFFRNFSLFFQRYFYFYINNLLLFLGGNGIIIGGNNLIRTSVLEKVHGYNTAISFYGEDTDTAKRISTVGKIVYSPKLIMKTSGRRLEKEGAFKIIFLYIYHFFKTSFSRAPSRPSI